MPTTTIPQPKPLPMIGNLRDIDIHRITQQLVEFGEEYGPIYRLQLGPDNLIVLNSHALIDEVCDETRFSKRIAGPLIELQNSIGNGLFTANSDDPDWGIAHRVLMPVFGPAGIRDMYDGMLDLAEQMMARWERFGDRPRIDASDQFTRLTLDAIALCGFDYRFNSFYQHEMHPFVEAMFSVLLESGMRASIPDWAFKILRKREKTYRDHIALMQAISAMIVQERKSDPKGINKRDLLSRMLHERDPETGRAMSDENIISQMITFLVAGHETTSSLLSFATYLLLENPTVLHKAREQVDAVLGRRTPTVNDLNQLPYIEQILKESLRIYPTAPAFTVSCHEPTVLGGKYEISPEDIVVVSLGGLHRDQSVWGQDANEFRPERFDDAEFASIPTNGYKPFGNGMRGCIGRPFAMQEAQLVIAMMLQRFDIRKADPGYSLKIKEALTIKPDEFYIHATRRGDTWLAKTPELSVGTTSTTEPALIDRENDEVVTPLLVLYGSNSGTGSSFAHQIGEDANRNGFKATVAPLNSYVNILDPAVPTMIIAASYEGQPTDDATDFLTWVESTEPGSLQGLPVAIFGCGNRQWHQTYQAIPNRIHSALTSAGAHHLCEQGAGDANADIFEDFATWLPTMWQATRLFCGKDGDNGSSQPSVDIEILSGVLTDPVASDGLGVGIVRSNTQLVDTTIAHAGSKHHIEISLPIGMTYSPGDYIAVLPENSESSVERILRFFGLPNDATVAIRSHGYTHLPTGEALRVWDVLARYVELNQTVSQRQLEQLCELCSDDKIRRELESMCNDNKNASQIVDKHLSIMDLVEQYPAINITLPQLLQRLPPLRPRQYSISSAPEWNNKICTLTVALVAAPAWSGNGTYEGVASNYLARAEPDQQLRLAVQPATKNFRPAADDVPMILVAAGSGIAPFRGFLQQRALRKIAGAKVAKCYLYFGCRHPDADYLYKDDLDNWVEQEIVEIVMAFSRPADGEKQYVQDVVWTDRARIIELFNAGAQAYLCGDGQSMAQGVRDVTLRIYEEQSSKSRAEAEQWLSEMQHTHGRIAVDLFS